MDLSMLGKLYTVDGPFVSVFLDATSQTEDAALVYDTKWKNLERELADRGADPAMVEAALAGKGEHSAGNTRVVIASAAGTQLAMSLAEQPTTDVVRVSPLPHVAPLVWAVTAARPHVVALIDRTGADIFAYTGTDTDVAEFATVDGDAPDVRKVHGAGGWRMRHMQARAEEGWEHNAKEIASTIDTVCRDIGATLVVAAGDAREIELVHADLAQEWRDSVERISGGRAEDGSAEHIFEQVEQKVEERRTKDAIELLEQYAENRGRGELAAEGLAAVVAALRASQVDTLIVTEDWAGDEQLWYGPEPMHLGATKDELTAMGVGDPQQTDAVDVLLRAAIATNSVIARVPGGTSQSPQGGVGALLRYDMGT